MSGWREAMAEAILKGDREAARRMLVAAKSIRLHRQRPWWRALCSEDPLKTRGTPTDRGTMLVVWVRQDGAVSAFEVPEGASWAEECAALELDVEEFDRENPVGERRE